MKGGARLDKLVGGVGITPPSDTFHSEEIEVRNNICQDYMTITWQTNDIDQYERFDCKNQVAKLLNIAPHEIVRDEKTKGFYGYMNKWNLGCSEIFYQDQLKCDPALNIHSKMVEISGGGMRELESRNVDMVKFAKFIRETGGTITRFDIAYDDFEGKYCDIFKIFDAVKDFDYVSITQSIEFIYQAKNMMYTGLGITLGDRTSNQQLQIYDKLLERRNKQSFTVDFVKFWHRYEIRFRHGTADSQFFGLHSGNQQMDFDGYIDIIAIQDADLRQKKIIEYYFSRLFTLLDIKKKSKDENKSRQPTVNWWKWFIGDHSKIQIRNQHKLESTITTKKDWVKRSVVKPLAAMKKAIGNNFVETLDKMIDEKANELTDQELLEIERYKKELKQTGEIEDWHNGYVPVDFINQKND